MLPRVETELFNSKDLPGLRQAIGMSCPAREYVFSQTPLVAAGESSAMLANRIVALSIHSEP